MLVNATDRTVPVTVQGRSTADPYTAFDVIVPIPLEQIFHKRGFLPGVTGSKNQTGPWDAVDQTRNPQFTDGSTADEHLTELTAPSSFAYEITNFTGPLRNLVSGIRGEWTFTPDGEGTMIRWTYEFVPRSGRGLLIRSALATMWRGYAAQSLTRAIAAVELSATLSEPS